MSDPISVAASIAGLIAISAKIVNLLKGLYSCRTRVRQIPESINRLVAEMQDMNAIFCQVQLFIIGTTKISNKGGLKMLSIQHLLATLSGCVLVTSNLDKYLSEVLGISHPRSTQPLANKVSLLFEEMKWALWKEEEVAVFIEDLQRHKLSLNLMLGIIQCNSMADAAESLGKLHEAVSHILESNHAISIQLRTIISRDDPSISDEIESTTVDMHPQAACMVPAEGYSKIPFSTTKYGQVSDNIDDAASVSSTATSRSTLSLRSMQSTLPSFIDELQHSRPYKRMRKLSTSDDSCSTFSRSSSTRGCSWSMLSNMSFGDLSISEISVIELPIWLSDVWDSQPYEGETLLHSAAGHYRSCQPLIPRQYSLEDRDEDAIRTLLALETDVEDLTPLFAAAYQGSYKMVELLLADSKVDVNMANKNGSTPLLAAAYRGSYKVVDLLLADGRVDVNVANKNGWTPLSITANKGHDKMVELLLADSRVDVNVTNKNGLTPLNCAALKGYDKVVELLLTDRRVDVNMANENGWTPLNCAADNGHDKVVELLLVDSRVDVNMANGNGWTPLNSAALKGHDKVVGLLLADRRVNVNMANGNGWTALNSTALKGHDKVVRLLLADSRVDVNMANGNGWTPLHSAALKGHDKVVELLLADGRVHVNMATIYSWMPPTTAAHEGHHKVVELLLAHDKINKAKAIAASKTATAMTLADRYLQRRSTTRLRSKVEKK